MKMSLKSIDNWFKGVLRKRKPVVKMPEDQVKEEKQNPFYIPEKKKDKSHKSPLPYFESQSVAKKKGVSQSSP